jgi:hypothetical protein
MLKAGGQEPRDRLSFFAADLIGDAGWREAVAGCDYVMHVASPIPGSAPKHEDELIIPAREGALGRRRTHIISNGSEFTIRTGHACSINGLSGQEIFHVTGSRHGKS